MKKLMNKKGFTIVELVIVIAVIAILAAVLIPTFSNLIEKANISNDTMLVKNLNTTMTVAEIDGKPKTMHEALELMDKNGYEIKKLTPTSTNCDILWNSVTNRFELFNCETQKFIDTGSSESDALDYQKWIIVSEAVELSQQKYSMYLLGDSLTNVIETKVGVDTGLNAGITSINYTNTESAKDIVIRTTGLKTTVNINGYVDSTNSQVGDTISHYGYAGVVNVIKCAMASYDVYGTVGKINLTEGHADIKASSTVYQLESANNKGLVSIDENANVYYSDGSKVQGKVDKTDSEAQSKFVTNATSCTHTSTELVVDGKHVYEICKGCGNSLVTVIDGSNMTKHVVVDSENNPITTPVATYTKGEGVSVNENGVVITEGTEPTISTPVINGNINLQCKHTIWNYESIDSQNHKAKCSSCELSFVEGHTIVEEKCTKCDYENKTYIAKVGENKYETLKEALNVATLENGVDLLTDVELTTSLGNVSNVLLNGNGYMITFACDVLPFNSIVNSKFNDVDFTLNTKEKYDFTLAYELNSITFNDVDIYGKGIVTGNVGAYCWTIFGNNTLINCDVYATMLGTGQANNYNSAFFGIPQNDSIITMKNCSFNGILKCGTAALIVANPCYGKATFNLTNVKNNGLIQTIASENNAYHYKNQFSGVTNDGTCTHYNITIDGNEIQPSSIPNSADTIEYLNGTGSFIWGPDDKTLNIELNSDNTLTITPATASNVSYYIVTVGTYVLIPNGSNRVYVSERIEASSDLVSQIKLLDFVDNKWVAENTDAVASELLGYTIYTKGDVSYYLVSEANSYIKDDFGKATICSVSAMSEDGTIIASAQLIQ